MGKCVKMTFTLEKTSKTTSYMLQGTTLKEVVSVRDLGIVLDSKLIFIKSFTKYTQ